ncbi:MAG: PIN domain-containing protein [Synergistaceae bacterium]|jgi:predicted nucleic acid-binding protein|nr:PIN domain-containing protein [Synergistaceae bacterium]
MLDTNVVLDAIAAREPFRKDTDAIFALIGKNILTGYVTASSVTDIYYVLRRKLSDDTCRKALWHLFDLFSAVPVFQEDCEEALGVPMEDFEDALIYVCARKSGVDYIVTRDEGFLKTNNAISPSDFLALAPF